MESPELQLFNDLAALSAAETAINEAVRVLAQQHGVEVTVEQKVVRLVGERIEDRSFHFTATKVLRW